jgi:hypothetical protein
MSLALRRLALTGASLFLAGCLSGGDGLYGNNAHVNGGAEDFPNTVARVGTIALQDVSESGGWEQLQNTSLPEIPDIGNLDSLRIEPPLSKRAGLARAQASADCPPAFWTWDIVEFLRLRRIRKITCEEDVAQIRRDTLFYYYDGGPLPATREEFEARPDSFALLVGSRGSITWPQSGKTQFFVCTNTDSLGGLDHGDFSTVQVDPGGQSTTRQRVKIYGPEGAYLAADATPEEFETLRLSLTGDTLEWTRLKDVDGDRAFHGAGDTGQVSYESKVRDPAGEPGTLSLSLFMKARLKHSGAGDSLKRLYYTDSRRLRSGHTTRFSFVGAGPDSVLRGNDTAVVTSDTLFAAGDSMAAYRSVYRLRLGAVPEASDQHEMVDYGVDKTWRRGPLRRSVTAFRPTVDKADPALRSFMDFRGVYFNGDQVQTLGMIRTDGIEMDYREVKGGKPARYRLVLNAEGKSVEDPEPLPVVPLDTLPPAP